MSTLKVTNIQSSNIQSSNGTDALNLDSSGRISTPNRTYGKWTLVTTAGGVRSVVIWRNIGNAVTSVQAGGTLGYGNCGRFTAPITGIYLITLLARGVTSASNALVSIYGTFSNDPSTNGTEMLDIRSSLFGTNIYNDGLGYAHTLYLNSGEYFEYDFYRPNPTFYLDPAIYLEFSCVHIG